MKGICSLTNHLDQFYTLYGKWHTSRKEVAISKKLNRNIAVSELRRHRTMQSCWDSNSSLTAQNSTYLQPTALSSLNASLDSIPGVHIIILNIRFAITHLGATLLAASQRNQNREERNSWCHLLLQMMTCVWIPMMHIYGRTELCNRAMWNFGMYSLKFELLRFMWFVLCTFR